jgi:hypothetical protein
LPEKAEIMEFRRWHQQRYSEGKVAGTSKPPFCEADVIAGEKGTEIV